MNDPYLPPRIPIPDDLSDDAAASLVDFVQGVCAVLQRHYSNHIARHYARRNQELLDRMHQPCDTDDHGPPF